MRKVLIATTALVSTAGCAQSPAPIETTASTTPAQCEVTSADLVANRALTWQQFDQQSGSPTTWRALSQRSCYEAAVAVYSDYLAFGPPIPGERWQTTARFHLGQSLAFAGNTKEAARVIATARRETEVGGMNWNIYVQGTYAFLVRDREALTAAAADLRTRPGTSNAINAGVLAGLLHCWDKPYREASTPDCVTASGYTMPAD